MRVDARDAIRPQEWHVPAELIGGYETAAKCAVLMREMHAERVSVCGAVIDMCRPCELEEPRGEMNASSGSRESASSGSRETGTGSETRMRLAQIFETLQRKMLGHVMARVEKAQRLLGEEIGWMEEEGMETMSAERQRFTFRVNQLLWPWMKALCRISNRKELRRIHEWWSRQGEPYMPRALGGHVVYARFNMETQHLYIGETEEYERRVQRHAYMTFRHSISCTKGCRGCSEHVKYRKHRVAPPQAWVVVPLTAVGNRPEARQMEDLLRLKWSPQLNDGDKPYYLMKNTYAKDIKEVRRRDKRERPPWKGTERQHSRTRQMVTRYDGGPICGPEITKRAYNLERVLQANIGKAISVTIRPGYADLTDWRKLRLLWGRSYVKVIRPDGSRRATTLEQWRPREERNDEDFRVIIHPQKAEVIDREQVIEDITKEQKRMQEYDEEHIAFLWRVRNTIDRGHAYKWRQVLWTELQRRYEGVLRKPIEIRIPYLERLDILKVKRLVTSMIEAQEWPDFLKAWHKRNFRVTTASSPNIEEIMVNVTKPAWIQSKCRCQELKKTCPAGAIVDGHVLMVGRDFIGDENRAMRVSACNVPRPGWGDMFKAWSAIRRQLPQAWQEQSDNAWTRKMFTCTRMPYAEDRARRANMPRASNTQVIRRYKDFEEEVPTTKQVYELRKRLKGMIIGPLDKNKGELSVVCPVLYHKALKKAYSVETGYRRVFPATLSQHRKKRYSAEELPAQIMRRLPLKDKRQRGTEKDLMGLYERIYKKRGWDAYAKFNRKGGLNQPYVLFKAKNVIDPDTRRLKWTKVRPIAPGTKHPMQKLMHYVGRAWSFVTTQVPGDHFVINKTSEVPKFLREAEKEVGQHGEIQMKVFDIESCYPRMPRETIRFALRDILKKIAEENGYKGVYVPRFSDKQPCAWRDKKRCNAQMIPFQTMLDVMEFSLDFAMVKMPNKHILRQIEGIPMGDPLSPGMTIGTCAWMEREWLETIDQRDRKYFKAKRFMDDILMVYAETNSWDAQKFMADFTASQCYQKPLKLEAGKEGIFLETCYWAEGRNINYKLKNDNANGESKVWRYQHWYSASPFLQKRATLTACLRKVQQMASSPEQIRQGGLEKIAEFRRLRYPLSVLQKACNVLGASTAERTWITVRDALR